MALSWATDQKWSRQNRRDWHFREAISLAPWLQPGVPCRLFATSNRFNGFRAAGKPLKRLRQFDAFWFTGLKPRC
jgi:hypothetical protein